MAVPRPNWHLSDAGILRKKEEDEELLVFGYSCKIFRDDEKALFIDQGKHLIPWMGDETLKIDRYDGRAALADLRESEAPTGGFDLWAALSDAERRVEQLCDEERYRALTHNEEEEALYQEEELKRLQQALSAENTYGQVAYQYDESGQPVGEHKGEGSGGPGGGAAEEDEPFVPPQELDIPVNMVLPETVKANAIIEKTAMFINEQGAQMEILLKMKQAKNPQFQFLSFDDPLHTYYRHLLMAIKTGRYRPKPPKEEEEDEGDQDDEDDGYYLHPSLASSASRIELAPSIPSINYKPSADCAYSMLVNKIRDKQAAFVTKEENAAAQLAAAAPITSSAAPSDQDSAEEEEVDEDVEGVGYASNKGSREESSAVRVGKGDVVAGSPAVGAGRKRRKRRGARRKRRSSGGAEKGDFGSGAMVPPTPPVVEPPPEMQIVIDKMASYVAKNGRDFETIVKSKGDPRFSFLEATHSFNSYYILRLQQYELQNAPQVSIQDSHQPSPAKKSRNGPTKAVIEEQKEEKAQATEKSKTTMSEKEASKSAAKLAPVCFSIKKPKEVEILPLEKRSALLLEESSEEEEGDEDAEGRSDNTGEETESKSCTKQVVAEKVEQPQPCVEAVEESMDADLSRDVPVVPEVKKDPVMVEVEAEQEDKDLVECEVVKPEAPKLEPEPSAPPAANALVSRDSHLTPPGIEEVDTDKDSFLEFGDSNSPGGLSPASAASRERQLQLERRRKAAIFLRMIKKEHPPEATAQPLQSSLKSDNASKSNPIIETIVVEDDDSYSSIPSPPVITLTKTSIPAPPLIRKDEWKFSSGGGGHNGVSSLGNREKSYRKVYSSENDVHDEPSIFHHRHHHHHRPHKHKHKHRKESSPPSPSLVHKRAHSRSRSKSKSRSDRPWKEGSSAPKHKKGKKKKARSRSRSSSHRHSSAQGHHHHHKKSKHHGRHKSWRRARDDANLGEEHQSRRHGSRSRESRYVEKPERRKTPEDVVEVKLEKRRSDDSSSSDGRTSGSESSDSRDSGR